MLVQAQIHVPVDEFGARNACQDTLSSVQCSAVQLSSLPLPPASVVVTQRAWQGFMNLGGWSLMGIQRH